MTFSTKEQFEASASSEKIGLVVMEAALRYVGWTLHSGSIYKITSFPHNVITSIEDTGVALTSVASVAACTAGKYYLDRENEILYLRTSDSVDPGLKFIAVTFKMFFADSPIIGPWDLDSGFDVEWLPLFNIASSFSMEVDSKNQIGTAIEGNGSISFGNERDFWASKFDRYTFENQRVFVYSWNSDLAMTEARLIFRGTIQGKDFNGNSVRFVVKDLLNALRAPVQVANIEDATYTSTYGGGGDARVPTKLLTAKQRTVYGKINGFVPINIDQVLTGYPLTGTFTVVNGSKTVTAVGGAIQHELKSEDQIFLEVYEGVEYTIDSMGTAGTTFTLTEAWEGSGGTFAGFVIPARQSYICNRVFQVAGHALSKPMATVVTGVSVIYFEVDDATPFRDGDQIELNGEFRTINFVAGNFIQVTSAFGFIPAPADICYRSPVKDVYIGTTLLDPETDYTVDEDLAQITLEDGAPSNAETNAAPIKRVSGTITTTSGSRSVTGSGSVFSKELRPGDWILPSTADPVTGWRMVWTILNDTSLTLSATASVSAAGNITYKSPDYYQEGESVLSCTVFGKTDDGLADGVLLRTAPKIVEDILIVGGLSSILDSSSFDDAAVLVTHDIGIAIPDLYTDTKTRTLRDTINAINQSVLAILFQTSDFMLSYSSLRPRRISGLPTFREEDIITINVELDSSQILKTVSIEYDNMEYDPASLDTSKKVASSTNKYAQYLSKIETEKTVKTYLVDQSSAEIFAGRWGAIYSGSSGTIRFKTKLQAHNLSINDAVVVQHEKLYDRIGSSDARKVGLVKKIIRTPTDNVIEVDDIGNAFSRVCVIAEDGTDDYLSEDEDTRAVSGFITDSNGIVGDDRNTEGLNLIW